jgi:hypothetical protein
LEHVPAVAVDSEGCTKAFNELERAATADILCCHDPYLLQHFIAYYATEVPQYFRLADGLLVNIPSRRGGIQGDSAFSAIFDVVYTLGILKPLAQEFPDSAIFAIHDDTYLAGDSRHLPAASARLATLAHSHGLRYGATKRRLYQHPPPPNIPACDIATHLSAFPLGATVTPDFFKAGGVPVGLDDAAVRAKCNKKAVRYGDMVDCIAKLTIGAKDKFPLLYHCARPSASLNHYIRLYA